jgi:hypothetical protein
MVMKFMVGEESKMNLAVPEDDTEQTFECQGAIRRREIMSRVLKLLLKLCYSEFGFYCGLGRTVAQAIYMIAGSQFGNN